MSDPNKKSLPPKKVVSNSLRLKFSGQNSFASSVHQKNMSTILNRLPFVHQITETERALMSLSPFWQKWCSEQLPETSLNISTGKVSQITQLKNLNDNGELTIVCENTAIATLIKHRQQSLLTFFNDSGFDQIHKIKIQSSPNNFQDSAKHSSVDLSSDKTTEQLNNSTQNELNQTRPELKAEALQALECVQSAVDNEQLSAALQRLCETLSQNSKKS